MELLFIQGCVCTVSCALPGVPAAHTNSSPSYTLQHVVLADSRLHAATDLLPDSTSHCMSSFAVVAPCSNDMFSIPGDSSLCISTQPQVCRWPMVFSMQWTDLPMGSLQSACACMHYTALHCTALHCTTLLLHYLHCTALHYTTTALHCSALHYYCTTLLLHCTALQLM